MQMIQSTENPNGVYYLMDILLAILFFMHYTDFTCLKQHILTPMNHIGKDILHKQLVD